jgi:hypothetical protein
MNKKYFFILIIFIIFPFANAISQNVIASAKLDSTNKILVGDQVKLKLQLTYPAATTISWPDLRDSLRKSIEIVNKSKIDTIKNKDPKNLTLTQTLTITSFDSGGFYIPQIHFKYKNQKDTAFLEVLTDSLLLNVNTIAVDTTKAIKDIKGPMSVPITFKELLPYIIGFILLAVIVLLLFWIMRKRKKGEPLFGFAKPNRPAHEEALDALEKLRNKKLWQNNKVKEYYTELTDIIRIYLQKRFNVLAMEMTTDEIMIALFPFMIQETVKKKFREMLTLSDLVKFAKANPLSNEHDGCLDTAIEFVNVTKPVEEVIEKKSDQQSEEIKNIRDINKPAGEKDNVE